MKTIYKVICARTVKHLHVKTQYDEVKHYYDIVDQDFPSYEDAEDMIDDKIEMMMEEDDTHESQWKKVEGENRTIQIDILQGNKSTITHSYNIVKLIIDE